MTLGLFPIMKVKNLVGLAFRKYMGFGDSIWSMTKVMFVVKKDFQKRMIYVLM